MGEFDVIERYFKRPARKAALGVGDDCALIMPTAGMQLAISSDMLVEGGTFYPLSIRLTWATKHWRSI